MAEALPTSPVVIWVLMAILLGAAPTTATPLQSSDHGEDLGQPGHRQDRSTQCADGSENVRFEFDTSSRPSGDNGKVSLYYKGPAGNSAYRTFDAPESQRNRQSENVCSKNVGDELTTLCVSITSDRKGPKWRLESIKVTYKGTCYDFKHKKSIGEYDRELYCELPTGC